MISITVNGVVYPVPSSAADTNWAPQQVAFEQALATAVNTALAGLTAPVWTAATLINSWATSGRAPAFYKDPLGFVHLRGGMSGGTNDTVAFVLPSGYRPATASMFLLGYAGGAAAGAVCSVSIATNGNVTIANMTTGADVNIFASIDGLSFTTAA